MRRTFALLALALLVSAEEERKAPAFELPDVDGKKHALSDYRGKVVVLEWVNHGCPYVVKHYKSRNMQNLQKRYTGKGVVWLTICSSAKGKQGHMEPGEWKKKNEELGSAMSAMLLDPKGEVGMKYRAKTTPHMFVIDKEGRLVYEGAIDDKPTTDTDDVREARNFVALAVDALLAGNAPPVAYHKPYG